MSDEVITHMRDRIERIRKVIDRAHDPEMIALLRQMVEEAEGDIRKLEQEPRVQTIDMPGSHPEGN